MSDVKPFFVPPAACVVAGPWQFRVDDIWADIDLFIEDWDQQTTLWLRSSMEVDSPLIRQVTGLADGTPLLWTAGWRTTDTGLVGSPVFVDFGDSTVKFDLIVPPERAGAAVRITRNLIVKRDRLSPDGGEAMYAGSILWSDETVVRLVGSGTAFPTEIADFATLYPDCAASWYLHLPSSVDAPAMGSMILMLNEADKDLVKAVSMQRPSDYQKLLVDAMEEGVIEELVRWAISRRDELTEVDAESVGDVAKGLARRVLPDPQAWIGDDVDSMALKAAIIFGGRRIGRGRTLS